MVPVYAVLLFGGRLWGCGAASGPVVASEGAMGQLACFLWIGLLHYMAGPNATKLWYSAAMFCYLTGSIEVQHEQGLLRVDGWARFKAPARIAGARPELLLLLLLPPLLPLSSPVVPSLWVQSTATVHSTIPLRACSAACVVHIVPLACSAGPGASQ